MRDVIVIGAGPAGSSCARTLAAAGCDVLVLEEHADVGRPVHCTGVIGLEAFDELELPRDTILDVARSARFRSPSGRFVVIESERILAAVVDRAAFDRTLADRARAVGATIRTGVRVERLRACADAIEVDLRGAAEPLVGRACVLACGANYRFNRALGLGVPRAFLQSAQVQAPWSALDHPTLDHIEVRFGRDIAPGGFAWAVPFRSRGVSHARIGLMCDTRVCQRFRSFVSDLGRHAGRPANDLPQPRLRMLPLGPVARTYARRVLAVGDAAGLVKPTTGGGIYYGVLSGRFAGETLVHALRHDALDESGLRVYEDRWRERLGPEIRAGLAFRAIASRLGDAAIHAIVELARVDGLVPLLKETANFNWHRGAALALLRNASFRKIVLSSLWT